MAIRRRIRAWGTGLLALALAGGAVPMGAAAAEEAATVLSTDFEDGSWAPWVQNGGPALSVVDADGGKALLVQGRANNWDGIKSPAGLLQSEVEYTFSMRVRLAEGVTGPAGVRFVAETRHAAGNTTYDWIGGASMTADAWSTVTGTYTVPAGASTQVYIGTDDLAAPYGYLVDDILITGPAAPPAEQTITAVDFDDSTTGTWTPSGNPALAYVDADGGKALSITRAADYEGIQSPVGLLEAGVEYTFSMRARLPEGAAGSTQVRFVVKPAYNWVGNATIDGSGWTTVTGTFTLPEVDNGGNPIDPAQSQVYIGTSDQAGPYTVLVDDILITAATGGEEPWEPTPDPDFVPGGAVNPVETPVASARGSGNVSALTFDDGPNPGETEEILDFLAANDLPAVFCVIGQNIQAEGGADILRRIVAEGHTLCNHTTSYADMGSWTHAAIEADLKANLEIIRDALGDPDAQVPYFRAPNGSWGSTPEVAVALGMQPLAVVNVINDWETQDEATLTANLRAAMKPGQLVLVHDGGGDRAGTVAAVETVVSERLAEGWTFTLPGGGIPAAGPVLSSDFEDGLDGWVPRGDAQGDPTVTLTTEEKHGGAQAALVSNRTSQGDGIGHDVTGLMQPGVTYEITAWVKMAAGAGSDDIWLSMQRTSGGSTSFDTVGQFADVTSGEWRQVTATYQMPAADTAFVYFETSYTDGGAGSFLLDDVVIQPQEDRGVQPLTPLQDTVDFPIGVAIDRRETTGSASELLLRHFDQITAENHMKPEAWYDAEGAFGIHPEAQALMDFAQANDLRVYGHTLVWHSQTPAWFFQNGAGQPLTTSETDQQVLRDRLRTHIFAVAEALSTGGGYGLFGSETNPLVAFDVVNEVVSDGREEADGLRRSEWYRILGEEYIDLAFQYADEAFNGQYAVEGESRPITLTINDYNTEQIGKQQRMHALVERLLARGVPVDAVGHQFHVSLAMPVQALEDAIVAFSDLPVTQVVSELDVTTGTPVTEALLVDQGYYYRDAFRIFREHTGELFSVTVWGLTDGRSWRNSSGAPLLFDDQLQAKPAYYGAADAELPAPLRTAVVFAGDVALGDGAVDALEWSQLPLHAVEDVAGFQLRWSADRLTAYVRVMDATPEATDAVWFTVGDTTSTVGRNGEGDVDAVTAEVDGGWAVVAHLPLAAAAEGDLVAFDVRATDGAVTSGWAGEGTTGTLTLVEPLSYTEVVEAPAAPAIDGEVDEAWAGANSVVTSKLVAGDPNGAEATVRTLWRDGTLYVLAEVADPTLDASGSDPWIQDSVEIFLDAGNVKNGPYRYDDTQIRISYLNAVSFGTGDEAFQEGRLQSATSVTDGGYIVEAAISLLDEGGVGTFHGLDFQVNDATAGARTAVKTWADPTGLGYQSTARWGVVQLVEPAFVPDPKVATEGGKVAAGGSLAVEVTGFLPGSSVELSLEAKVGRSVVTVPLGAVTMGSDGSFTGAVTVPTDTRTGKYTLVAESGELSATADASVQVQPAPRGGRS
ncbi:endo-1,4-beta-xylanase [Naasia sp. SYSU D00948]|uniref:endo-1,4-beta-xylanase n=1 Tax=Naasia sp. SYSU D00948 TaxID=2817379 RepID=UPI001B3036E2|nr:endo-1,4-beta-xylanase [Naasia sp. SYSU D00948]